MTGERGGLEDAGVWEEECPSCRHRFLTYHRDSTDVPYVDALALLPEGCATLYVPIRCIRWEDSDQWDEYICPRCNHQWEVGA
jgi:DNA-directed RNA polymerase subunit RPC12/RpoP